VWGVEMGRREASLPSLQDGEGCVVRVVRGHARWLPWRVSATCVERARHPHDSNMSDRADTARAVDQISNRLLRDVGCASWGVPSSDILKLVCADHQRSQWNPLTVMIVLGGMGGGGVRLGAARLGAARTAGRRNNQICPQRRRDDWCPPSAIV
jgi:hypothetical protein